MFKTTFLFLYLKFMLSGLVLSDDKPKLIEGLKEQSHEFKQECVELLAEAKELKETVSQLQI